MDFDCDRRLDDLAGLEDCDRCGDQVPARDLQRHSVKDKDSRGRIMNICPECRLGV